MENFIFNYCWTELMYNNYGPIYSQQQETSISLYLSAAKEPEEVRESATTVMGDPEKSMEQSLLLKQSGRYSSSVRSVFIQEVKRLGYLAGPMVAVTLSQYMLQMIATMMVGHLGELALSSTAIAISLGGVTGFSFLVSHFRFDGAFHYSNGGDADIFLLWLLYFVLFFVCLWSRSSSI